MKVKDYYEKMEKHSEMAVVKVNGPLMEYTIVDESNYVEYKDEEIVSFYLTAIHDEFFDSQGILVVKIQG